MLKRLILIFLFSSLVSPLYAASFDCNKATTETEKAICSSAQQGDVDAQYDLGIMYIVGEAVVQDYERAAHWLSKAGEQGHLGAQWALGLMYGYGEGVELNYDKAVYWYTKAAEQGDARAQNDLGLFYYDGLGVEQNFKQAAYWLSKSAEQGHSESQNVLGFMYYNGLGVGQNHKKAAFWLSKAAAQGVIEAQLQLESIQFEKPYGQLKSGYYFKAVAAFQKNAEVGSPISLIYLFITLDEEGMAEYETKFEDACTSLTDNFSKYIDLWENDAPLNAASAFCQFDTSLLEEAELDKDPFAMLLSGFIPSINQDPLLSNHQKALDMYLNAALVGYCPAIFFSAGTYLDENSEAMIKPSPTIAYAWHLVAQKFGCPVTLFESDFDNYSDPDQEFAQNLAANILKRIQENVRELQND